jgi:poly-gamma-glutamate synthesis protein (capsule biosynthesis protein)
MGIRREARRHTPCLFLGVAGIALFLGLGLVYWKTFLMRKNDIGLSQKPSIKSILLTPFSKERRRVFVPGILSLEKIFSQDHTWVSTLSAERVRTLITTGDVILGRSVNFNTAKRNDFHWPFEKTAEILRAENITFVNFEAPLIANCQPTITGMVFCGDPRNIEGLLWSGVDVASLANNHMGNYGKTGIDETIKLLNSNGILVCGTGSMATRDVSGLRFGFLGYNSIGQREEGISWANKEKIVSEISELRKKADIVVVAFHWGVEYTSQPTELQKELAHLAIDSGADLVLGNHPHWIQPVELYKDKLIVYAHGNFVFDQMWSEKTREGVIGRYVFYDNKLVDVEFLPIVIEDYGQPNFPDSVKDQSILDSMREESIKLLQ